MSIKKCAIDRQVGGNYYKQYDIQPYEFFIANQVPHHKAAIIRRILRYDTGGRGIEDLKKIMHECELILELSPQITFWSRCKETLKRHFDKISLWDFLEKNMITQDKARIIKTIYLYDTLNGLGRIDVGVVKNCAKILIER